MCRKCGPWQRGAACSKAQSTQPCHGVACYLWNLETPARLEDQERKGEQGQRGAKGSHSTPEGEVYRGDLSSSSLAPAGEGPSLCPAVVPPLHPPPLQLSWLHQSHPRLAGRRRIREEGASQACASEVPLAPASKGCLQLDRLPHCWVNCGLWAAQLSVCRHVPPGGGFFIEKKRNS